MLLGELHRAKKIASNFDIEIKIIVNKYTADFLADLLVLLYIT